MPCSSDSSFLDCGNDRAGLRSALERYPGLVKRQRQPIIHRFPLMHIAAATHVRNFALLAAQLFAMNCLHISARMTFSVARGGYAPQAFGRVTRRGQPLPSSAIVKAFRKLAFMTAALWLRERARAIGPATQPGLVDKRQAVIGLKHLRRREETMIGEQNSKNTYA